MEFILTTIADHYTKEEAKRLEKYGFEFREDPSPSQLHKPFLKITGVVKVHVGNLHALMGLIEQLGTIVVQGPSTSTSNYSLFHPGDHQDKLGVEPQIIIFDDYI